MKNSILLFILLSATIAIIAFTAVAYTMLAQPLLTPPVSIWLKQAGGNLADSGQAVVTDVDGNIVVMGQFEQSATFDGVTLTGNQPKNSFLAKYSPNGGLLWIKQTDALATDLAIDGAGNLFITGYFTKQAMFEKTTVTGAREHAIFIAKYASDGNLLWAKEAGSSNKAITAHSITVNKNGFVMVSGSFKALGDFDTNNFTAPNYRNFLAGYDENGTEKWVTFLGDELEQYTNIVSDGQDDLFVIGTFKDTGRFDQTVLNSFGGNDAFIARYTPVWSGQGISLGLKVSWVKRVGGAGNDGGTAITVDKQGNVFVTGYFTNQARFEEQTVIDGSLNNVFIAKYDANGNLQWANYASSGFDIEVADITLNDVKHPILLGNLDRLTKFPEKEKVTPFSKDTRQVNNSNIFLAQYDKDVGKLQWSKILGGDKPEKGYSLAHDGVSNLYLTGQFEDRTVFDELNLTTDHGKNIFIYKSMTQIYPVLSLSTRILQGQAVKYDTPIITQTLTITNQGTASLTWTASTDMDWLTITPTSGVNNQTLIVKADATALDVGTHTGHIQIKSNGGNETVTFLLTVTALSAPVLKINANTLQAYAIKNTDSIVTQTIAISNGGERTLNWTASTNMDWLTITPASGNAPQAVTIKADATGFPVGIYSGTIQIASNGGNKTIPFTLNIIGPPPIPVWAKQTSESSNRNRSYSIAKDDTGHLFITGVFEGRTTFGDIVLTSRGKQDIFIVKYTPTGQVVWAKQAGGSKKDQGFRTATDSSGHLLVAGHLAESTQDDHSIVFDTIEVTGSNDGFVAKYRPTGQVEWVQVINGQLTNGIYGLATDSSGNVLVAGFFYGTIELANTSLTAQGDRDILMAKFRPDGSLLWAKQFGGQANDWGQDIVVDSADNIFLSGYFKNQADFGGTTLSSPGREALFVAKYNSAGALLWVRKAPTTQHASNRGVLTTDSTNNLLVAGQFYDSISFGTTTLQSKNRYSTDVFMAKYQADGTLLWAKQVGGENNDYLSDIATDKADNILVTGQFSAPKTVYPTPSNKMAFMAKYGVNGAPIWAKTHKNTNLLAYSLVTNPDDDIFLTGGFQNNATLGNTTLTGYRQSFIARFAPPEQPFLTISSHKFFAEIRTNPLSNTQILTATDKFTITNPGAVPLNWTASTNVDWLTITPTSGTNTGTLTIKADGTGFQAGIYTGTIQIESNGGKESVMFTLGVTEKFNQVPLWAKKTNDSAKNVSFDITTDKSGNMFMTGYFERKATFGRVELTAHDNSSDTDLFIVKYNSSGNVIWAKKAGGSGNDQGNKIVTDAAGNLFVSGSFHNEPRFDSVTLKTSNPNANDYDSFIAKYSTAGQVQWAKAISGTDKNGIAGIATDSSGNLLIVGFFNQTIELDNNRLTAAGEEDILMAKFGPDGSLLWVKQMGSKGNDGGQDIATDSAGNIFISGYFDNQVDFGGITLSANKNSEKIFIAKYSPAGKLLWVKAVNQRQSNRFILTTDRAGNLFVSSTFDKFITFGNITLQATKSSDIFITKYSSAGDVLWAKQADGGASEKVYDITTDSADNVLIMGQFDGTATFYPTQLTSLGRDDIFMAKYAANGALVWVTGLKNYSFAQGHAIAMNKQDDIFLTGIFSQRISLGETTLTSGSSQAFWTRFASLNQPIPILSPQRVSFKAEYNAYNPPPQQITISNKGTETLEWTVSEDSPWLSLDQLSGKGIAAITVSVEIKHLQVGTYTSQITVNSNGGNQIVHVTLNIIDAPPTQMWVKQIGGQGDDFGTGIAADSQNNVLVTGQFSKTVTIGTTTLNSAEHPNSLIAKYSPTGVPLWAKQLGGTGQVLARGLTIDSADNVLVIGHFNKQLQLGQLTFNSRGEDDVFVAKYDPQGNLLWARTIGGQSWERGYGISTDSSGNVLVTGYFRERLTFGPDSLASRGLGDIFIAKYKADGTPVWARQAGGPDFDEGHAIAVDSNGNIYVTGYFRDKAQFDTTRLENNEGIHHETFFAKYNTNGQLLWAKQGRGSTKNMGQSITTSNDNLACVTGYFHLNVKFDELSIHNHYDKNGFIVCYDMTGKAQWVEKIGRYSDVDSGYGVTTDSAGNLFITGQFGNKIRTDSEYLETFGRTDIFITRYKPNSELVWVKQAGGSSYDAGYAITIDKQGYILTTGRFERQAQFDQDTVTSAGQGDIFINKQGYPTEPFLSVSAVNLKFKGIKGGTPSASQLITITNSGLNPLSWTVSDDADWLTVSQVKGIDNTVVVVSVDVTSLDVGNYQSNLVIDSNGGQKSIPVTLNYISTFKRGGVVSSVRDTPNSSTSQSLQQARNMGLDVIVMPLGWDRLETGRGRDAYNWGELDDVLKQAKRYGLKVVLRIYNAPAWHTPDGASPTAPPTDPERMQDLIRNMVRHLYVDELMDQVAGLVIWNEPNIPDQWGGQPANAEDYMALLKAAHKGVSYYDLAIVSAGLAPTETGNGAINDLDYLAQLYDLGLANYVDYVGAIGLGFQHDPDYDPGQASYSFSRLKYMHDIMVAKGDPYRRVWALEVGWLRESEHDMGAFNAYKVSAEQQTQYISRAFEKAEQEWTWLDLVAVWNLDFNRFYPKSSAFHWYTVAPVQLKLDHKVYLPLIHKDNR